VKRTDYPMAQPKDTLDTPALLVDLDIMEANIGSISRACKARGVGWRPHIKGHKTPEIARLQLAAGAIGITCAKLGEAEVMAAAGIRSILIANQIVGPRKISRLLKLLEYADPILAVDNAQNVADLAAAARSIGRTIKLVIEVNIGMNRAGIEPGPPLVSLADAIRQQTALSFVGLMGWESQAAVIVDPDKKAKVVAEAIARLTSSAQDCRRAGHDPEIVSCGGTGTYPYCLQHPGITEVQIGGGIFSDVHYREHYHFDLPYALTLLATVTSRPTSTRIVLDAGKRAMTGDAGMPLPIDLTGVQNIRLSAEHATIELDHPQEWPAVGDHVEFVIGHTDTTVHLHEEIIGIRNGIVESVWPVAARGRLK
jgi:D-serine deaminase-like pyridoxal phosphate-dependent protein